jgi:hypothetical protein
MIKCVRYHLNFSSLPLTFVSNLSLSQFHCSICSRQSPPHLAARLRWLVQLGMGIGASWRSMATRSDMSSLARRRRSRSRWSVTRQGGRSGAVQVCCVIFSLPSEGEFVTTSSLAAASNLLRRMGSSCTVVFKTGVVQRCWSCR